MSFKDEGIWSLEAQVIGLLIAGVLALTLGVVTIWRIFT